MSSSKGVARDMGGFSWHNGEGGVAPVGTTCPQITTESLTKYEDNSLKSEKSKAGVNWNEVKIWKKENWIEQTFC